ncbi:hypothetical protein OROMI_002605 [Orobanche minor]
MVSQLENLVADKQKVVSKLQENHQKLEESLVSATMFTSRRHVQLTKLHKCYLHMRDSDKILKRSEQELQMADPTRPEFDILDSEGLEYHRWVFDVETTFVAKEYSATLLDPTANGPSDKTT